MRPISNCKSLPDMHGDFMMVSVVKLLEGFSAEDVVVVVVVRRD